MRAALLLHGLLLRASQSAGVRRSRRSRLAVPISIGRIRAATSASLQPQPRQAGRDRNTIAASSACHESRRARQGCVSTHRAARPAAGQGRTFAVANTRPPPALGRDPPAGEGAPPAWGTSTPAAENRTPASTHRPPAVGAQTPAVMTPTPAFTPRPPALLPPKERFSPALKPITVSRAAQRPRARPHRSRFTRTSSSGRSAPACHTLRAAFYEAARN